MSGAEVIAGRFAIVRPMARGNMGQVYEALDERTGEKVAVKTLIYRRNGDSVSLGEADKNTLRFQREVRIMSRLHSDNLTRIIDGGLDGDRPISPWNTCRAAPWRT
jgi:serine/threonine-protein kinase